jgi:amino acid efflux transporter
VQESGTGLRRKITLRYAVALYMSSVLGSGVLVLPGLAAKIAGPASLLAWILLSLASYPLAYTFASLSARKPESGGVYSFAKEAFGPDIAAASSWLFAAWYITGAPAVTVIAASYLAFAFPLGRGFAYIIAAAIILGSFSINYRGIVVSSRVQLGVITAIAILLLATVIASVPSIQLQNFQPFFPNGILPVGTAAALIFWSYLGYENVSNIAEEFKDPQRDFHRSIVLSVAMISVLYLSVAVATVGTRAYQAGGSVAPFAAILSNALGPFGASGTAILAVFIIFGTVNAYTTGMSRVIYSAALDGSFPRALAKIHSKTGVPHRAIALISGSSSISLTLFYFLNVDLETALLIPSGAAILVYVIGSASGIKLLGKKGLKTLFPWVSLAVSLAMLPFVGIWLIVSVAAAVLALLYYRTSHRRQAKIL